VEALVGKCSLYLNYLVQSSFSFGVGTAFPHIFFSTTPLMFITRFFSDEERTCFDLLDWTFLSFIVKAKGKAMLLYLLEEFLMK